MDDKDNNSAQVDENVQRALSITIDEFAKYFSKFEKINGDLVCPLCKHTLWGIASREDSNDQMAIVTLPIPFSPGRGMWAYPIFCKNCGYIATFSAMNVSRSIRGE